MIKFVNEEWCWKKHSLISFIDEGNVPENWEYFFAKNYEKLKLISEALEKETNVIYPSIYQTFRSFIPLDKIKVCVIAQDPYFDGNACGLCFSVSGNKINPSLRNIYKELKLENFKPKENGNLVSWKDQGCMLLNMSLTVLESTPGIHLNLWKDFTENVVKYIDENTKDVVWLLMGTFACSIENMITSKNIFKTSHPSPFSALKPSNNNPAFIGSNVFKKINDALIAHKKTPIIW